MFEREREREICFLNIKMTQRRMLMKSSSLPSARYCSLLRIGGRNVEIDARGFLCVDSNILAIDGV